MNQAILRYPGATQRPAQPPKEEPATEGSPLLRPRLVISSPTCMLLAGAADLAGGGGVVGCWGTWCREVLGDLVLGVLGNLVPGVLGTLAFGVLGTLVFGLLGNLVFRVLGYLVQGVLGGLRCWGAWNLDTWGLGTELLGTCAMGMSLLVSETVGYSGNKGWE